MNAFLAVSNPDSSAAIPNQILPLSCTPKKREEQLSEESRPWPLELIFWKWKAYGCGGDWMRAKRMDPISGPPEAQKPIVGAVVQLTTNKLPDYCAKNRHREQGDNELCEALE